MLTTRSTGLRWLGAGVAAISLAIALGCSRTTPPPPPPTGATPNQTSSAVIPAPTTPMTRVAIPATAALKSWANRGISGWQANQQGQGVACSFRSTAGSRVHYGGVSLPIPGAKSFRLTVTFTKGASAVKSLFVIAQGATGKEVDRWGYDARKMAALIDGRAYVWDFTPGRPVNPSFWNIKGQAGDRATVSFFVDVDPAQEVSFTIDKIESE